MADATVLRAGSRARDDTTTTPPGFVAPVVAFNNPPALLDPAGSGVLGAVAERQPLPRHERLRRDTGPRAGALQHSGAGATATASQAAPNLAAATRRRSRWPSLPPRSSPAGFRGRADRCVDHGCRVGRVSQRWVIQAPPDKATDGDDRVGEVEERADHLLVAFVAALEPVERACARRSCARDARVGWPGSAS